MQHAKFAMLDELLDPFKRADFTQHFMNKGKNYVGWCWIKFVLEQIFHSTFSLIQHQNYMLDSFKVVYHPTFSFQHHFEC